MDKNIERKEQESLVGYTYRLLKNRKEYKLEYLEIENILFNYTKYSSENFRKFSYLMLDWLEKALEEESNRIAEGLSGEEKQVFLDEIELAKFELIKERKKNQAINVELNKMAREQGRDELFYEIVEQAIENRPILKPMDFFEIEHKNKDGVLCMTDFHYGREVVIRGLKGEIISEYNPKVFKQRMEQLMNETIEICKDRGLEHLHVVNLADCIDGLLRISQLQSLSTGVVDSVVEFEDILALFLDGLTRAKIKIDYYQSWGNHDELRLLTGKKGDFAKDNVNKLILKMLEKDFRNNPNIIIHNEGQPFVYFSVCGSDIFGYHGEDKNLANTAKWFEEFYGENIDYVFAGHLHSASLDTTGMGKKGFDKQVIRIPSLCGIDDYSVSLRKSSNAGANIFVFEEGKGKKSTEDIWLA